MGNLGDIVSDLWALPDRRPTWEWAAENVELFPPINPPGMFDPNRSRHFKPIFDALDDDRVREVNILKPVRGGGSLIGDIHLIETLSRNRGPYLSVFQTEQDAKMHFFDRIEKMLAGCKETIRLLPHRYEWSEIFTTAGITIYTGGPSVTNLQSKGVRYVRLDECWMYPPGRMAEAEARVGDYLKMELSKILRISQGGPNPPLTLQEDDWFRAWNRCEQHELEVQCSHCGKFYPPVFTGQRDDGSFYGLTWDKHQRPNGEWHLTKCVESARFECFHCSNPVIDSAKTKNEWNRTARFKRVGEENRRRVGFHWESVFDYPWDELVTLWLDACNAELSGNIRPKLQFYQKRLAQFKDEESLLKSGLNLSRVAYEIESDWPDEKARFMSVDRQQEDVYWWTVRAWSESKTRRLAFGKAYSFGELEALREKHKVPPNRVFIDSRYQPKGDHGVYLACIQHNWIAVSGDGAYSFTCALKNGRRVQKCYAHTWGDPSTREARGRQARIVRFSKPVLNQRVQELIDSGAWEEPPFDASDPMEKEYNSQMSGRTRRAEFNKKTNETRFYWRETKNDHARDLANHQVLGAILVGILADPVSERGTKSETNLAILREDG